jgi:hypothetical protein
VINPRVGYLTLELGPRDESEAQISKDLLSHEKCSQGITLDEI